MGAGRGQDRVLGVRHGLDQEQLHHQDRQGALRHREEVLQPAEGREGVVSTAGISRQD